MLSSPAIVDAASCALVARETFAFLDGALVPDAHVSLAAHLTSCADCDTRVADARRFLDALRRSGGSVTAPATLHHRVRLLLAAWRAAAASTGGE